MSQVSPIRTMPVHAFSHNRSNQLGLLVLETDEYKLAPLQLAADDLIVSVNSASIAAGQFDIQQAKHMTVLRNGQQLELAIK